MLSAAPRGDRTVPEVAEFFAAGTAFVNKVLRLRRAGLDLALRPHGGGHVPRLGAHTPLVGAMGLRGLAAAPTVEGAVETDCFNAYAGRAPGTRPRKGDVVALDDLGARRASRIGEVAEARGARVLWPAPYSPDFSPIGQCWPKVKAYLGGAKARTRGQPDGAPAAAIKLVTKSDIRGWLKRRGYSLARE